MGLFVFVFLFGCWCLGFWVCICAAFATFWLLLTAGCLVRWWIGCLGVNSVVVLHVMVIIFAFNLFVGFIDVAGFVVMFVVLSGMFGFGWLVACV